METNKSDLYGLILNACLFRSATYALAVFIAVSEFTRLGLVRMIARIVFAGPLNSAFGCTRSFVRYYAYIVVLVTASG